MADNNTNLPEDNTQATIEPTGNDPTQGAQGKDPEDTHGGRIDYSAIIEAQRETIEQQQETISEAFKQVSSLNAQIADYVRSVGSRVNETVNPDDKTPEGELPEDYVYLKDLGKEIGKRN